MASSLVVDKTKQAMPKKCDSLPFEAGQKQTNAKLCAKDHLFDSARAAPPGGTKKGQTLRATAGAKKGIWLHALDWPLASSSREAQTASRRLSTGRRTSEPSPRRQRTLLISARSPPDKSCHWSCACSAQPR